jgi:DNA-binding CsgD family transcriptional regulator
VLIGRDTERQRLLHLLADARSGTSGVLVIRGEAGIGKSALLDELVAHAGDATVLRVRGVESEAELPYAALHRLLRPAFPTMSSIAPPQADALRRALGMEPGRGDERFLVSVAVLSLLDVLGAEQPVLCVVDDAHWLDAASADALTFVARRLLAESVVVLFAVRDPSVRDFVADDLPHLRLGALDSEAAGNVLLAHTGVAVHPDVRARLATATGGNALALVELARALDRAELTGERPLPMPLPVTGAVENAFLDRVLRLPDSSQTLLRVAAADDAGRLATIIAAAEVLGVDAIALRPAEQADVVRVHSGQLEFRHPLVRSAVYQGATFSDRQAAHRALAAVLDPEHDADRRAWHRAAATVEADPEVAGELVRAAQRARARGAFAAAAAAERRSAELTTDVEERARRFTAAGADLWRDGRGDQAAPLLREARAGTADPALRVETDRLIGLIELRTGGAASACRTLRSAAESAAAHDPVRALELLGIAAQAASFARDTEGAAHLAGLATALPVGTGVRERFLVHHVVGLAHVLAGDLGAAAGPLTETIGLADRLSDPQLLMLAWVAAAYLGDEVAARRFSSTIVARARDATDLGVIPLSGVRAAISEMFAGRWAASAATATEALQLARVTGQHTMSLHALAHLGVLAALRGDRADGVARVEQARPAAAHRSERVVEDVCRWALGLLELPAGEPQAALAHVRDIAHPIVRIFSGLDRVEAAHHAGDLEQARVWSAELGEYAAQTGQPWAMARAAHARALLAPPAELDRHMTAALAHHDEADRPFERARTELAFGAGLRRARRRVDARTHLQVAFHQFEELGAPAWAHRAQIELRACGQAVHRRVAGGTIDRLTPQEVQVAQFVARGLSNVQVAAQLVLSRRTIDFHLRNVFTKLGISSRTELARLVADQPGLAAGD